MEPKFQPLGDQVPCGKPEWRIVSVYVLFAGLWIFFSDRALTLVSQDPVQLQRWQTYKGWAFVLITAVLLYTLLHRAFAERRRFEEGLRQSEKRLRRFVDANIIGIMVADIHGQLHEANDVLLRMLGYSRQELIDGKIKWDALTPQRNEKAEEAAVQQCIDNGFAPAWEKELRRKDGTRFPVMVGLSRLEEKERLVIAFIIDLTEFKRTEQELRKTEERLENAQRIAHLGNWDWEVANEKLFWSDEIYRIFGLDKGTEVPTGGRFLEAVPEEDRAWVVRVHEEALKTGRPLEHEYRIVRSDGKVRWVREKAEIITNAEGKPIRISGTIQDITDRRQAMESVQDSERRLRALSARLETLREEERRRISREIHDELGQMLTALKMDLRWMEKKLAEREADPSFNPFLDRVVSATELVDATIVAVQRISSELRPGILDSLGLLPALQHEAAKFQERTGITCTLDLPEQHPDISPELSTSLYRIFQECLTNVSRHAKASLVHASFQKQSGFLLLEIADNGGGLPEKEIHSSGSMGLVGMQERAMLLGGTVRFERPATGGTLVRVRIPMAGDTRSAA
ncbi:MAG TPA: PAS domain S-box protein [Candidatus Saccharimonadales bacterium]|nr:PAS domain S-box protein [Candidatus Saccharimonadales bacterium]